MLKRTSYSIDFKYFNKLTINYKEILPLFPKFVYGECVYKIPQISKLLHIEIIKCILHIKKVLKHKLQLILLTFGHLYPLTNRYYGSTGVWVRFFLCSGIIFIKLIRIRFNIMNKDSLIKTASVIFIITAFIFFLIVAKNILIPLAFGGLLAYLMYPIVRRLERIGIHRSFSILIVIIFTLAVVAAVGFFFAVQISNIQIDLNEIKTKLVEQTGSPEEKIENKFGVNMRTMDYYIDSMFNSLFSGSDGQTTVFSSTTTTIFQIGILPVFIFFLLFYRTKTAYFIFRVVGRRRKKKTVKILREIKMVTTKYLGGLIGVVIILAVLNSTGLLIIGVPHAIVLGVAAAILNLIPYFGTLIGALIPIFYVLVAMDDPLSMALKVVFLFIIVQFLENNIITPNVVGGNVRLNALTVIIGLLIGNMIWGLPGMLVVIPFIAVLKIIMKNIEGLEPYAYLLSSKGLGNQKIDYIGSLKKLKNKITGNKNK